MPESAVDAKVPVDKRLKRLKIVLILRAFLNVSDTISDVAWLVTVASFTYGDPTTATDEVFFSQGEAAAVFAASLGFLIFETLCQILFTMDFSTPKVKIFRKVALKVLHVEQVISPASSC